MVELCYPKYLWYWKSSLKLFNCLISCPKKTPKKPTQTQKHQTAWRREACPPRCRRRVAEWAQGPGDRASHLGSAACLLSCCKNTSLPQSAKSLWNFAHGYNVCSTEATCFDDSKKSPLTWWKCFKTNNNSNSEVACSPHQWQTALKIYSVGFTSRLGSSKTKRFYCAVFSNLHLLHFPNGGHIYDENHQKQLQS